MKKDIKKDVKNSLAKLISSFAFEDKYIGVISFNGKTQYEEFEIWLNKKLETYKGKTVKVTIEISPEQNVKVIESRKAYRELVYA